MHRRILLALAVLLACATASAAPRYRAFWVETFHTPFVTRDDVDSIIAAATRAKANAVFMEVRRRGDAWYFDAAEPRAEGLRDDFDPLRYLIDEAHARVIEVHAFTIVGSVFHASITSVEPNGNIDTTITGTAYQTGTHDFVLVPEDELGIGFVLR